MNRLALSVLFASALLACGDDAPAPPPTTTPEPPVVEPPVTPARTLVAKPIVRTDPQNLLVDPEFQSLWSPIDETGFGIYESFVEGSEHAVRFLAQTPVGPGAAVLEVKAAKEARLTMTVTGGAGPLTASVWVSGAKIPEVQLASLYEQSGIVLAPDESTRRDAGGRSWVELRGVSPVGLPGQLYFVATSEGDVAYLAPSVLSGAITAKKSLSAGKTPATARALEAARRHEELRARYITMAPPPSMGNDRVRAARSPSLRARAAW